MFLQQPVQVEPHVTLQNHVTALPIQLQNANVQTTCGSVGNTTLENLPANTGQKFYKVVDETGVVTILASGVPNSNAMDVTTPMTTVINDVTLGTEQVISSKVENNNVLTNDTSSNPNAASSIANRFGIFL